MCSNATTGNPNSRDASEDDITTVAMHTLRSRWLGRVSYHEATELQLALHANQLVVTAFKLDFFGGVFIEISNAAEWVLLANDMQ